MTFFSLDNLKKLSILYSANVYNAKSATVVDMDNNSRSISSGRTLSAALFSTETGTVTAASESKLMAYASADTITDSTIHSVPNQVGAATIIYSNSPKGWIGNVTITGNAEAQINSLIFSKRLYVSSSVSGEVLLFALNLDSPVTLNAGNNFTASFTVSADFG